MVTRCACQGRLRAAEQQLAALMALPTVKREWEAAQKQRAADEHRAVMARGESARQEEVRAALAAGAVRLKGGTDRVTEQGLIVRRGLGGADTDYLVRPADREGQLRFRRLYHEAVMAMAVRDFGTVQRALTGKGPPVAAGSLSVKELPPDGVEALRDLRDAVRHHRDQVRAIDGELAALPGAAERRRRQEALDAMHADAVTAQSEQAQAAEAVTI